MSARSHAYLTLRGASHQPLFPHCDEDGPSGAYRASLRLIGNFLPQEEASRAAAETAMAVSAAVAFCLKKILALPVADSNALGLDFACFRQAEGQYTLVILGRDMLLIYRGR